MFETKKADWYFIIPATIVWLASLLVTAWDFAYVQLAVYRFDLVNLVGLISMLSGIVIRRWAKMNLGGNFSPALRIRNASPIGDAWELQICAPSRLLGKFSVLARNAFVVFQFLRFSDHATAYSLLPVQNKDRRGYAHSKIRGDL
jgi:hypothetical protein